MKKKFRISKPSMTKTYSSGYASSFWSTSFDTNFKVNKGGKKSIDHTKLAATQRAIANFVNIVTGKQIPVVFQSTDESYTDGKQVVIGTKLEDDNFDPAVGLALHEGSHILLTNFNILENFYRLGSEFHQFVQYQGCDPELNMTSTELYLIKDLLNWVEDRRIDYHIYTTAPGYRMYYEAMYDKYFNSKIVTKALQSNIKRDEDMESYIFRLINLTNKNRDLDALKGLKEIWDIVDLKNINRLRTTEESLKIACDIYKVITKYIKKAEEEEKKKQCKGQEGKEEDDENKKQCNGGDQSIGFDGKDDQTEEDEQPKEDVEATQVKSDLSNAELKRLEKAIQSQNDFVKGKQKKVGRLSKKDARIVKTLKESGTESVQVETNPGQPTSCPVDTIVIKKMTPAIITSMDDLFDTYRAQELLNNNHDIYNEKWGHRYSRFRYMQDSVDAGIVLGKQLGKKLQLRNDERSLKSTRLNAGKIDRRLISQLGYNNASVFHRIVTDKYKNFFIHISIDASGSMGGRRIKDAIKSAVAIAQAASMTTGIRVQISLRGTAMFNGGNREKTVTLYAYDSAYDKMIKIKTYFKFLKCFGVTPEGIAFQSIFDDVKKDAKGDECIFINYSDGYPSHISGTDWYYNGVTFTKKVVNKMREIGINVIGYFIDGNPNDGGADTFRKMYGQDSEFIDTGNMTKVSNTMNKKFLEISDRVT